MIPSAFQTMADHEDPTPECIDLVLKTDSFKKMADLLNDRTYIMKFLIS
jgi:hypothetical protein